MYDRDRGERVATELLCQPERVRHPVPRAVGRGVSIVAVLAACLLMASTLMLFFQVRSFLGHIETALIVESGSDTRLRAIGLHMESLRGRFHGLLAESVEMRLKSLEKNVEAGKITADEFHAFEELRKDIRLLESYAGTPGAVSFDYSEREHSRFRAQPEMQVARNNQLMSEVLEVKRLFYWCLAGIATGTLMMAGYYWMRYRQNARSIHRTADRMPLLTRQAPNSGR